MSVMMKLFVVINGGRRCTLRPVTHGPAENLRLTGMYLQQTSPK